jgi:peptidoglycan/LPS O-acetylase OafA/YrhL
MKSSSGSHFIALDHVRALAALIVFTWHFLHSTNGSPIPFDYVPAIVPFAILDEGHTGVALFMTLSGYLFAKLLDGSRIHFGRFMWNRAVRLLPLLCVVILVVCVQKTLAGEDMRAYAWVLAKGLYLPTLPNGGWSIAVEFHYYLILPLLLWLSRRSRLLPLAVVVAAIALRIIVHARTGEVQTLSYWTIFGRIDQFALGMVAYRLRALVSGRHGIALAVFASFSLFYWSFDALGGFFQFPSYPSPSPLWIVLPTVEGVAFGVGIAWYESSFALPTTGFSAVLGRIGDYSYSMYLLHFFFVFAAAKFVNEHVADLSNFYVACLWAVAGFVCMLPLCYLSFRFLEAPFLRLRKPYIDSGAQPGAQSRL